MKIVFSSANRVKGDNRNGLVWSQTWWIYQYGTAQAWLTFGHARLNSHFLASDWLSGFHTFPSILLKGLVANLVDTFIVLLPSPDYIVEQIVELSIILNTMWSHCNVIMISFQWWTSLRGLSPHAPLPIHTLRSCYSPISLGANSRLSLLGEPLFCKSHLYKGYGSYTCHV